MNTANDSKHYYNLNSSSFTLFINHCEDNSTEKVSFSDTQNPKAVFNKLTVDENYYLLIRDNLTETIQIQLSRKQKTFLQFFLAFLKFLLDFKHLPKKDHLHS